MYIQTERLVIAEFRMDMAEAVHLNSLDEATRRFVPDEVFETAEDAAETVSFLIEAYKSGDGPFVYPLLHNETYVGYVQAVLTGDGEWEIGYHIGENFRNRGFAAEAVKAFLPGIMQLLGIKRIKGICLAENIPSQRVMERCGFFKEFEGIGIYQGRERKICKYAFCLDVDKNA